MNIELKLAEGVNLPEYKTEGSSGADITANSIKKVYMNNVESSEDITQKLKNIFEAHNHVIIRPNERILFGTGLTITNIYPNNIELQVRPRSGLSLKKGLIVVNSPGTIDNDYRGEIGVIIMNVSRKLIKVEKGERIAQLVVAEIPKGRFYEDTKNSFNKTQRGDGGFGSTGEK